MEVNFLKPVSMYAILRDRVTLEDVDPANSS